MSIAQTCIYDTLEYCKYAKYWYGKPVVSKCKDCNKNPNNHPKTQVGTKEELKSKISFALKDPILRQSFEIICKENIELKKENEQLQEKLNIRSCQNCKHNNKSCPNDGSCVHYSKWEDYKNQQLTKAKEIIKDYMIIAKGAHITVCGVSEENRTIEVLKLNEEAEQFIKDMENEKE